MATPTELFINSELPKRPYTNQFPLEAGHVPVATGNGLEVAARALTTSDISGMNSYATQEDLSNVLAGLWDDRGAYTVNAAGNINYPSSAGSGVAGAIMKGDIFTVAGAVAGVSTINNIAVNNGDTVRALVDNPSATNDAHWAIAENNIGYVPENTANKTTDTDLNGAAGTYPDTPTVKSYIDKYDISAASINSTGTVTLTRTASNLTFQVPTAISGLSFDPNTGILTSSYTNNAASTTITVAASNTMRIIRVTTQTYTVTSSDADGNTAIYMEYTGTGNPTITIPSDLTKPITIFNFSYPKTLNITWSGSYPVGGMGSTSPFVIFGFDGIRAYPYKNDTLQYYQVEWVNRTRYSSNMFMLYEYNDTTKALRFDTSGIGTGQFRTIIMPDSNVNLGNVAQAATGSTNGYLSSTDWSTFNGKQAALADVVTANTYGSSTQWPIVTVNAKGIVTGVTLQTVPTPTLTEANFAVQKTGNPAATVTWNLSAMSAAQVWYAPNATVNFGHLSSVATTNSNVLGGTDCRIEGGTNNDVSGTMCSTYNCKYHTVVGTYNKAMLSIPTSGTGIFTHAGAGNTYFGHTHTGNTTAIATTDCTFYNCFKSVGHSLDVNVVYRSAGNGSGSDLLGFVPHTQVTGNGVSKLPLKALCMLKSAAVATGVSTTLVSHVSGAFIDKPPLISYGGNGAVHDIVFNCYDTNLFASPRYMLCLRRQVTVYYDSSTPVITQATLGTDLNPAGLTYSIAISVSGTNRMLITVTATDPVLPAPPFPLTYEWAAIVESSYF